MGSSVKIMGADALAKRLNEIASLEDVKTIVKTNGMRLEREIKAQTATAYKMGYSEGYTADSVSGHTENDGLTYVAGEGMEYDPYVEYGTRFMEAEPTVGPAHKIVSAKFKSDLEKLTR